MRKKSTKREQLPLPVILGGMIVALTMTSISLLVLWRISTNALEVRSTGVVQQGKIADLNNQKTNSIDVDYTVAGKSYRTAIAVPDLATYAAGQEITLYVDPADPTKVVTAEGHSATAGLQRGAQFAFVLAAVIFFVSAGRGLWDRISRKRQL